MEKITNWISINDSLPEDSIDCLVVRKDSNTTWIEIAFFQKSVGKFPHRFMINGDMIMYSSQDVTH